jgi:hypothetical protein
MALLLHCDGCHAQDDSLDGNKQLPPQGAPCATNEASARIKVWRDVVVFGDKFDLCNRCIAKISGVLQRPIDSPAFPPAVRSRLKDIDPEISGRG